MTGWYHSKLKNLYIMKKKFKPFFVGKNWFMKDIFRSIQDRLYLISHFVFINVKSKNLSLNRAQICFFITRKALIRKFLTPRRKVHRTELTPGSF